MNTKLLRKIQKHFLEEPRRLIMRDWIIKKGGLSWSRLEESRRPPCGTAACIGGTAKILSGYDLLSGPRMEELLELTEPQAFRLFYVTKWPAKFKECDEDSGTPEAAKIVCARIDHFIKTEGRE